MATGNSPARKTHPATRKTRPATRRPLTRERIFRAALRLIDERGARALTMRKLGAALDVEAMSLYKHVKNKEDVIRGVVELIHSEIKVPDKPNQDWQSSLYELTRERRATMVQHPNMVPYLIRYGGESVAMQAVTAYALECATSAGLRGDDAHHLLHLLTLVILGSVILDERERPDSERARYLPREHASYEEYERYFRECNGEVEFEFGLRLILKDFASRVAES
jgi:AcrR family transcriptional regulator